MLTQGTEALFFFFFKKKKKRFAPVMFGVVWDTGYSSKLKGKQYKHKTTPKTYKTQIKIIANSGLA